MGIKMEIPVSFKIGSRVFFGLPEGCGCEKEYGDGKAVSVFKYAAAGLDAQVRLTEYDGFDAREWVLYLKNNTDTDSEIVTDVLAASLELDCGDATLLTCNGDFCSNDGYETVAHEIKRGGSFRCGQAPVGGRPCDRAFPYQRLLFDGGGLNLAIGWPGQWSCLWEQRDGKLHFEAGQQQLRTVLHPGEELRTPCIALVGFTGTLENGVNVWRRWFRRHVMRKNIVPFVHGVDNNGGQEFTLATCEQQLSRLREYSRGGIDINLWWIDAGWYPSVTPQGETNWWKTTGTWECDSSRFPDSLAPIGEYCNAHGIRLLTWFEVERANENTRLFDEHPEWMLKNTDEPMRHALMLDLTNPECVEYIGKYIADFLIENRIGLYRQDYNFEPLSYWRYNEPENRLGMCENKYVCGYLRYWDYLLEAVPDLIIDSCASGGRRNDLETMRRAIVLHQTDEAYGNHPVKHAFFQTLYSWLPYFRGFTESWEGKDGSYGKSDCCRQPKPKIDSYNLLSALAPCMSLGGLGYTIDCSDASPEASEVKKAIAVWKAASEYLLDGDFYALTPYHKSRESWTCWQFDLPEKGEGIFEVIRNNAARDETLTVRTPVGGRLELTSLVTGERMVCEGTVTFRQPVRSVDVWRYVRADG